MSDKKPDVKYKYDVTVKELRDFLNGVPAEYDNRVVTINGEYTLALPPTLYDFSLDFPCRI